MASADNTKKATLRDFLETVLERDYPGSLLVNMLVRYYGSMEALLN